MNNNNNNNNNNNVNKYNRQLSFVDIVFAGYGFIIGAGIFTLMPYIIGYSKGYSWGAFFFGFIISILTGLSFARLNFEYPQNEAEYAWIMNILSDFVTNYPYVKVWGIIFQKFKIILEKSNILRKEYIYKLDRFVDKVQQYIYTLIYRYSNSSKEDKYYQTDYIQDEFTEFLKDKRLLYIYDLTDEKFNELMKEPQFI